MQWNWQRKDWPNFRFDKEAMAEYEAQFLRQSGVLIGASRHFSQEDRALLTVEMMTGEAIKTSEIEGEHLNRDSVQSSIRRQFGLQTDNRRVQPAERGIADMMVEVYRNFAQPLSHATLCHWHRLLTGGRQDLHDVGRYRTHHEPMQVISGPQHKPHIHFEAPPSGKVKKEMERYIAWFVKTAPKGSAPLPALTRTGLAHLYFVSIHPFEDGNGRIGRAIAEKSLSECMGQPTLIALSQTIQSHRNAYYEALEKNNKDTEVTDWLLYFAGTILAAQEYTQGWVDFVIEKTRLYDKVRDGLNERQAKALERLFREGPEGFEGGLSAENYISITGASRATATRDLQGLIEMGALIKTGALKGTRYWLNVKRVAALNLTNVQ